jgi:hypothetical protein
MLPTLPEEERRWPVKLPFISLEHLAAEVPRRSNIEKGIPAWPKKSAGNLFKRLPAVVLIFLDGITYQREVQAYSPMFA